MEIKYSKILIVQFIVTVSFIIPLNESAKQKGPDPWEYDFVSPEPSIIHNEDIPPDLRVTNKKSLPSDNSVSISDIFFRRMLGIILKGGQTQEHEDGSVEILLQMKFDSERWNTLDKYIKSNTAINEAVLRRSMGYIEEAIYKPTILDKIAMVWSDHVKMYLIEYKIYIVWSFGVAATVLALIWLWKRMSHRHLIWMVFLTLYFYEVFISYKEAEQHELERFLQAMKKCQWQFWTSDCEVPPPDIIIFMKHMNPLKIAIRLFTTVISEPMITLSATIKTIISGITDGLWFPFDKIVYGFLIIFLNALLIVLLIIIVFNYLLNIPFKLGFLGLSVGIKQRNRSLFSSISNQQNQPASQQVDNTDRVTGATLNKILDVVSHALNSSGSVQSNRNSQITNSNQEVRIRRSASTGRLPTSSFERNNMLSLENGPRRRPKHAFYIGPSGDAC